MQWTPIPLLFCNPVNGGPWYSLAEMGELLETPEWTFKKNQLRRFR